MKSTKSLPWIGEFPSHWDVMPNKSLIRKKKVSVGSKADEYPLLSLTKRGVIIRNIDEGGKFPENFDTYQRVSAGDLVTCLFDVPETPRTFGISSFNGMITGAYDVFTFTERINPKYFEYYYLALDERKGLSYFYSGLRNVIRTPVFLSIPMPVPTLDEQSAIAEFLARELAQIESLILKQNELVEKLKFRKQALIYQRVTSGYETSVDSKDWLDVLPAGWNRIPLREIANIAAGGTPTSNLDEYWTDGEDETGIPWLSISDFEENGEVLSTKQRLTPLGLKSRNLPVGSPGTILFAMYASVGATTRLGIRATWSQAILGISPKQNYSDEYLYWVLKAIKLELSKHFRSNTQDNINASLVKSLRVPLPPLKEQIEISRRLKSEVYALDKLVDKALTLNQLLKLRRESIVSDAVTGKIDFQKVS
jgi:type I restriction enzyme S subunit